MTPLRFALIGSPVAHSKSPSMHGAAYAAFDLPHSYEKLETSEADVAARIESLRQGDFAGLNVTVPHKLRALALADEVDESARLAGAANTLARRDGRVVAYNTDMPALALELARLSGSKEHFRGTTAIVLGTGGAARAAITALATELHVARIVVRARAFEDVARTKAFLDEMTRALESSGKQGPQLVAEPLAAPEREASDLSAIVQTTSCGMTGAAPGEVVSDAIRWDSVPSSAVALDAVYAPLETPFLVCAKARGLRSDHGLGMLARQGALAFEHWLGLPAPYEIMLGAIAPK
ncbi:Shikimate 5-dehydrogenase I alpha [Labilithrix luteola]|uniref:Shikimate dehydrogenase (NADP(+)) n=1 Tax=Labilithrix luteola TaxID=1391654 RepID=A0A0K1PLY6_9BACT|nr:shikimate dehydrogenase [Labilithrix luteola]AKU94406.1 Shikimate 5-dehydrogenase I alpha [Labilithrix luteola]